MLASTVLTATGLIGIFASLAIRGPDIFDPVIGLTYGNPYLAISGYGSALSATERAKMLGELRVRLGDVKSVDQIGRVALGKTEDVLPIMEGKFYE